MTLAVEERYGTNIVLDPSLPLRPEFRRNSRCPCASSSDLCLSQRCPPYAEEMIAMVRARVEASRVAFDVCFHRESMNCRYRWETARKRCFVGRSVDCVAILYDHRFRSRWYIRRNPDEGKTLYSSAIASCDKRMLKFLAGFTCLLRLLDEQKAELLIIITISLAVAVSH